MNNSKLKEPSLIMPFKLIRYDAEYNFSLLDTVDIDGILRSYIYSETTKQWIRYYKGKFTGLDLLGKTPEIQNFEYISEQYSGGDTN